MCAGVMTDDHRLAELLRRLLAPHLLPSIEQRHPWTMSPADRRLLREFVGGLPRAPLIERPTSASLCESAGPKRKRKRKG
jgi:hypothetical protein